MSISFIKTFHHSLALFPRWWTVRRTQNPTLTQSSTFLRVNHLQRTCSWGQIQRSSPSSPAYSTSHKYHHVRNNQGSTQISTHKSTTETCILRPKNTPKVGPIAYCKPPVNFALLREHDLPPEHHIYMHTHAKHQRTAPFFFLQISYLRSSCSR